MPGYAASRPGIQVGAQLAASASDEDIAFVRQLGVEWIMTGLENRADHSAETYVALRKKFKQKGLKIYRLANPFCHNMEEVILNLAGRDEKIEEYLRYIRNLGAAGIRYATYAHMANGIWSSGEREIRGGAIGRTFSFSNSPVGQWLDRTWKGATTHGRRYGEEELWENFKYFIRRVAPVAEEAGVCIGIHPDDPPIYDLGGIPRCLFGSFEGYRRAIELADSPFIGVCLCVGCWLEGGAAMGKSVVDTIRYFGARRKLFKVHVRNVTAPMPEGFTETLPDDGYMDMSQVMRALKEVGFDGAVISDHLPRIIGGRRAAEAFSIGYLRALVQTVESERNT